MMPLPSYDVIIAGAGSIGTPTAFYLAQAGLRVLVLETLPSVGQASNKHAIGGIRATHSDESKYTYAQKVLKFCPPGARDLVMILSGAPAATALSPMNKL